MNKQELDSLRIQGLNGRDSIARVLSFDLALDLMKELGTSVQLNWGEDNNLWELAWITGGERVVTFSKDKYVAVKDALIMVEERVKARIYGQV